MPQHYCPIGFYFRSISNSIDKRFNQQLKSLGLTKSQLDVLFILSKNKDKEIIQRDIENYFHISNPTVTGILNRLEQKGYIVREQSKKDKRIHHIKCMFDEAELRKLFTETADDMETLLTKGFSEEEKIELAALLERVMNNGIMDEKEDKNDKNLTCAFERV